MDRPVSVVILAAGKGTRMKSDMPKVLHPIGNAPMIHHSLASASALDPDRTVVVVGHGGDEVIRSATQFVPGVRTAVQAEQLGTGHAVSAARAALAGFDGDLLILFGDTPFLTAGTLGRILAARRDADLVVLGFDAEEPGRYGRLVLAGDRLDAIVEAKDATPEQLAITTCNSGVMAADCRTMLALLDRVSNENAQGEYYLTDIVGLARSDGLTARAVFCDEAETMGINDRVQLADAERIYQDRARRAAMLGGATLISPETVFFSLDTQLGRDVTIQPGVFFGPGVSVGDGCEIKAYSHIEQTSLAPDVKIGPFARLRGGNELASGVRIGNFVELKNAHLAEGTKAGHLTYLGDARVGQKVNFGAGTITCNYDGFLKHQTTVGSNAFVGVQTALVAPVIVGDDAYIGTGTVVTKDVPPDALALSRTPQTNRENTANRLRAKFARKSKK